MKKYATLFTICLCIFGMGLLACVDTANTDSTGTGTDTKQTDMQGNGKPSDINEAFDQVVQVLHTPYSKGDDFFKIFTGNKAINERKKSETSGTWSVKAGKDNKANEDSRIVYEYKGYQPKGSAIKIDGKMAAMYRSKGVDGVAGDGAGGGAAVDAIGFNTAGGAVLAEAIMAAANSVPAATENTEAAQIAATAAKEAAKDTVKNAGIGTLVETLNISGAYDATLTFTYPGNGVHPDVTASNYDEYLFGENGTFTALGSKVEFTYADKSLFDENGTFTSMGSKVEFAYADKTITLNVEQLKKLLHIS